MYIRNYEVELVFLACEDVECYVDVFFPKQNDLFFYKNFKKIIHTVMAFTHLYLVDYLCRVHLSVKVVCIIVLYR